MVGESDAQVYQSSPFPTKPSQILPPGGYNGRGATFNTELGTPNTPSPVGEGKSQITEPLAVGRPADGEGFAVTPAYSDVPITQRPSIASFSTPAFGSAPPSHDTDTSFLAIDKDTGDTCDAGQNLDDIVQFPSVPRRTKPSRPDITNDIEDKSSHEGVTLKHSDTSLSSTNSTGTVIVKSKHRNGPKHASYSAFPNIVRPRSSKSDLSLATPQKLGGKDSDERVSPISSRSQGSAGSSSVSTMFNRRTSSVPMYSSLHTASQSSVNLQYPVIRPPTASASWAESPTSVHQISGTTERNPNRWNPHLSTVQSETTSSEERNSQIAGLVDSSLVSKSSSVVLNARGSSDMPPFPNPLTPQEESSLHALPNPPSIHHRDATDSTIRVVNEDDNNVPNIPAAIPGSRGSEYQGVFSAYNRRSFITTRGSRASFFRDSIPAWARYVMHDAMSITRGLYKLTDLFPRAYYARPPTATSAPVTGAESRPSASTEIISLNIFRPRSRAQEANLEGRRSSLAIRPTRPREIDLTEIRGPPRRKISPNWSPHLWHDRISLGRRQTIFQAPSLDEAAEGRALNKRNIQIMLFAFGFVFSPGKWILGSCNTMISSTDDMFQHGSSQLSSLCLESQQIGVLREKRRPSGRK